MPGWYPDPWATGGLRWFDGTAWTGHLAPASMYGGQAYKGARLGRPPVGTGALASPGRRLAARLLDSLVILPVLAVLTTVAVLIVAPHAGPMFPQAPSYDPNAKVPTPGIVWIYLTVFCAGLATGLVNVVYETLATYRYGRTLGKAWMKIRPVTMAGAPLGFWRSFGRIAVFWAFSPFSWLGLIDPLWCLWDQDQQCLHDKVADSIVVND
ncbi:MAG TPA: RDD family protein [Acidimicrobiales bacterium]|jgi:uncharacterized RDD family membrane protein YckC|nr:RDD family protein [Acidimicrobiales bacterium]